MHDELWHILCVHAGNTTSLGALLLGSATLTLQPPPGTANSTAVQFVTNSQIIPTGTEGSVCSGSSAGSSTAGRLHFRSLRRFCRVFKCRQTPQLTPHMVQTSLASMQMLSWLLLRSTPRTCMLWQRHLLRSVLSACACRHQTVLLYRHQS